MIEREKTKRYMYFPLSRMRKNISIWGQIFSQAFSEMLGKEHGTSIEEENWSSNHESIVYFCTEKVKHSSHNDFERHNGFLDKNIQQKSTCIYYIQLYNYRDYVYKYIIHYTLHYNQILYIFNISNCTPNNLCTWTLHVPQWILFIYTE